MNTLIPQNPCVRCGKNRIVSKTWKEKVNSYFGATVIVHTETVCPDKECQKQVEEKFAKQKEKSAQMQHDKEERLKLAKAGRLAKTAKN